MRRILILLLSTSFLAACGNNQEINRDEAARILNDMKGPEIQGVDSTMLAMAQNADNKGDYRASASIYQQMMDKDPSNVAVALNYAEALRRSGKPAESLQVYNSVVAKEPQNQDALEGKGLAELSLADVDGASQTLTRVMSLNANRWRTLNGIGVLFAVKGMTNEALQYMNAGLRVSPNNPAILNNKGLISALERNFPQALQSLSAASMNARTSGQQMQADMNAALVYAISGDMKRAEEVASRHLQGPALQNNLGQYALLTNDETLARTHLQMALSESKTFYEKAWNNLADLNQSTQTGQIGTEKRVDFALPTAESNAQGTSAPENKGNYMGVISNSPAPGTVPQYTPQGVSGAAAPAPYGATNGGMYQAPINPQAAPAPVVPRKGTFESVTDYLTDW